MEETLEILGQVNQEELLPKIIRSEVNSLIYPIFALNTRETERILEREYRATIQRDGQRLEVLWRVSALPRYKYPGPFEKQVHRAIEKIINSLPLPIKNPIRLGSFRNLARLMGLKPDREGNYQGHVYEDIKDALIKIKMAGIESKGTFYSKGKRQWIEDYFNLYERMTSKGEELPDGTIADTNYLFLGSWYLESVNSRYVRPLDYTYLESLSTELSRRFYELFGTKFYYILQHSIPHIRYKYSTLCQLLPVIPQRYYSDAKKLLNPSHQELIRTGFFEDVRWPKEKISQNPPDWFIYYFPGPKAKEEYQNHQNNYSVSEGDLLQLAEINLEELPTRQTTPECSLSETQQSLLKRLIDFGITEKIAQERVRELDPQFIASWLEAINYLLKIEDKKAYLVKALKEKWMLPENYLKLKKQKQQKEAIKSCSLCNEEYGWLAIKDQEKTATIRCPHSEAKLRAVGFEFEPATGYWIKNNNL